MRDPTKMTKHKTPDDQVARHINESEYVQMRRQLTAEGLLYDSGERRDGEIVWKLTPAGKAAAEKWAQEEASGLDFTADHLRDL